MHFLKTCMEVLAFASISVATNISLPKPSGPYGTIVNTSKLVDISRIDPYSPTNASRALMISIFQPVKTSRCSKSLIDYMPPATASLYDITYGAYGIPNGTFESLKLQVCSVSPEYRDNSRFPIVIFSPGLGDSRHLYNSLVQSVSSVGYTVVSIDHPHDANIVEYPDGSTVLAADIETDAEIELALATRAQDVSFVLDQLSKPFIADLLLSGPVCSLSVDKVGIFGHSLGGATSIAAMVNDSRIAGGINLDGTFFGPSIQQGTNNPFLLIGHEGKNQSTDPSWGSQWENLKGWKVELEVNGTAHGSFTDLPTLVDSLGLTNSLPAEVTALLGSISGLRAAEIKNTYVGAFFDMVLKGKKSRVLSGESKEYPEVIFVDM